MMNDEESERRLNGCNLRTYFINPFMKFGDFESSWENEVHHRIKGK
jgi:hypothetical protein